MRCIIGYTFTREFRLNWYPIGWICAFLDQSKSDKVWMYSNQIEPTIELPIVSLFDVYIQFDMLGLRIFLVLCVIASVMVAARRSSPCNVPQCRMACQYGYERGPDGCAICSCKRNRQPNGRAPRNDPVDKRFPTDQLRL